MKKELLRAILKEMMSENELRDHLIGNKSLIDEYVDIIIREIKKQEQEHNSCNCPKCQ